MCQQTYTSGYDATASDVGSLACLTRKPASSERKFCLKYSVLLFRPMRVHSVMRLWVLMTLITVAESLAVADPALFPKKRKRPVSERTHSDFAIERSNTARNTVSARDRT